MRVTAGVVYTNGHGAYRRVSLSVTGQHAGTCVNMAYGQACACCTCEHVPACPWKAVDGEGAQSAATTRASACPGTVNLHTGVRGARVTRVSAPLRVRVSLCVCTTPPPRQHTRGYEDTPRTVLSPRASPPAPVSPGGG